MMRRYGDLMASVGEYKDQDGKRAKRWTKCGTIFRDENTGSWSVKLDSVPVSPAWSGWLAVRNIEGDFSKDE